MTDEAKLKLIVSTSPHIRDDDSAAEIMWTVFITLIPAGLAGVYVFGYYAAQLIGISVLVAILTEFLIQRIRGVPVTILDGSAAVTGLLMILAVFFSPLVAMVGGGYKVLDADGTLLYTLYPVIAHTSVATRMGVASSWWTSPRSGCET